MAFSRTVRASSFLALASCASAAASGLPPALPLAPPQVPASIVAPAGEVVIAKALAEGTQVYVCTAGAWTLQGPEAELKRPDGGHMGRHFAGPSWALDDGSQVKGELVQKVDAPNADAVPWVLLRAASHAGAGALARVTSIQRVDTVGGKAPAGACEPDARRAVPYTATYYFYAPAGKS